MTVHGDRHATGQPNTADSPHRTPDRVLNDQEQRMQRPVLDLWREARDSSDDVDEQNYRWRWLMIAVGHMRDSVWQEALGHRILAQHGPGETCADCPCWHCGSAESDPDGDHSCPCPYHDNDCPWHVDPMRKRHVPQEAT